MSRGGRGGWRGGRGGSKPGGGPMIPRELAKELELKPDFGPTELFPEFTIPFPAPLSSSEKTSIARFLDHREKIHNGPLYTVLGRKRGLEDPFMDLPTYSGKYHIQRRKVPKIDARPYVLEFFPKELWSTMDPTLSAANLKNPASIKKKKLLISSLTTVNGVGGHSDSEESDDEEKKEQKQGILSRLNAAKEDEDNDLENLSDDLDDEDNDGEEDVDPDQYDDDEEGDYNAEQYFEGGDGDEDYGDYDEGGGGGAYYD